MADNGGQHGHLDATGGREVMFCHQCENEWYRDEHNGLDCPRCQGEITEIVTPGDADPRPSSGTRHPATPPGFHSLQNHNPWEFDNSDPEEVDIEQHLTRVPGGSIFISQTQRPGRRGNRGQNDDSPDVVMRGFHDLLGTIMGPGLRPGQTGRSGQDNDLFASDQARDPHSGLPRIDGIPLSGGRATRINGGFAYTYTSGPRHGRNEGADAQPPDHLAQLLGSLFANMGNGQGPNIFPPAPGQAARGNDEALPAGLNALFASLLNPANARHGDAVYTQEALDQIISTLMEQTQTSNAPGPASDDAIASLPRVKLDEKLLPEGKGDCTICIDTVVIGDEVVLLPCSHWFHEECAASWLKEHNTCPICRKGITGEGESSAASPPPSSSNIRSSPGARFRNAARLNSIRNAGQRNEVNDSDDTTRNMPGAFHPGDVGINRATTSGSDQSQRSSSSLNRGSGLVSWMRDHFTSNNNNNNNNNGNREP